MFVRTIWGQSILRTRLEHLKKIQRTCRTLFSGMELREVVQHLKNYAPLSLAESWDNAGLLVEPSSKSHFVHSILLTNDLTEGVMEEAIEKNANMILAYHPPIFSPLKTLTRHSWKERVVLKAVENRIAIYSPHTAFDVVKGGVNDWLATGLGAGTITPLKNMLVDGKSGTHNVEILVSKDKGRSLVDKLVTHIVQADNIDVNVSEHLHDFEVNFDCNVDSLVRITRVLNNELPLCLKRTNIFSLAKEPLEDTGIGRLCTLIEPVSVETIITRIKEHLKLEKVRFAQARKIEPKDDLIKTVAICAGSGGSVLKGVRANMYLTGEMSHHDVLDAVSNGTHVVLGEHSNTERGFLKDEFSGILFDMLEGKVEICHSSIDKDPVKIV